MTEEKSPIYNAPEFTRELGESLANTRVCSELIEFLKSEQDRCQYLLAGATAGLFLIYSDTDKFTDTILPWARVWATLGVLSFVVAVLACGAGLGVAIQHRQRIRLAQVNEICTHFDIRPIGAVGQFSMIGFVCTGFGYLVLIAGLIAALWA